MRKNVLKYMGTLLLTVSVAACSKSSPDVPSVPQGGEGNEGDRPEIIIPDVPEAVNEKNLIYVDYFSNLDRQVHFTPEDIAVIKQHVTRHGQERPVMYMIEGMEFKIGGPHPLVKLSRDLEFQTYFAQSAVTSDNTYGTGILTPYLISEYDGLFTSERKFMSGCKLRLPLSKVSEVLLYTTHLETVGQLQELMQKRSGILHKTGVIVGTAPAGSLDALKVYAETKAGCRFYNLKHGKEQDVVLVMPPNFAFRGFVSGIEAGKLEYYRLKIEKLK